MRMDRIERSLNSNIKSGADAEACRFRFKTVDASEIDQDRHGFAGAVAAWSAVVLGGMFEAGDRGRRFERGLGLSVSEREADRVVKFKLAHDAAVVTLRDAGKAEHDARVEQTHTQHRVHRAAQRRQRAVEDAKTPPPNRPRTLAERMSELAGRLS